MKVIVHIGQRAADLIGKVQRIAGGIQHAQRRAVIRGGCKPVNARRGGGKSGGKDDPEIIGIARRAARQIGQVVDIKTGGLPRGTQGPGFDGEGLIIGRSEIAVVNPVTPCIVYITVAVDKIVASAAIDGVVAGAPKNRIGSATGADGIIAGKTGDGIAATPAR